MHIGGNLSHVDAQTAICIHQAIVNCFVLPWTNVATGDQDFERRSLLLKEYIASLSQDLLRLDHTLPDGQQEKVL